ncbi:MAG: hypothetical protein JO267_08585 [Alphaproteobacteria bacterium]|nr:hypothetical protein [Alphaproteobacteria bacterium]
MQVVLGPGLLRPFPGAPRAAAGLSAVAKAISGPQSPADGLDPGRLLGGRGWESPALLERAAASRGVLVANRLGGPWWADAPMREAGGSRRVLVAFDHGTNGSAMLSDAIEAAFVEHPASAITVLAPAPRRRANSLRSALAAAGARGCRVLTGTVAPWSLLDSAEIVYAAGGESGFLGLLAGREVRCFGASFYSGWGVTRDLPGVPQQPFRRTIDEIFAGSCLLATRYLDPYHVTAGTFEDALALLADWRRIEGANRRIAVCVGMSFWKRRRIADFLHSTRGTPAFRRTASGAVAAAAAAMRTDPTRRAIAAWSSRMPAGLTELTKRAGIPLLRVEDGFIRSVGLGSDFLPAASVVIDATGMYFDPRGPSDLENLLCETEFDAALVERARRLIDVLVARGITKYNLGRRDPDGAAAAVWRAPSGVRRVLVPGQVEDDLSVVFGGGGIRDNLTLLGRVRAANPDAFIAYKPHPDVEAGHRKGRVADHLVRQFADMVIRDVPTAALLGEVDELHTLTSLAGFEALLRGLRVVVYGRPFYAGWGLTEDVIAIDRGRHLSLGELVAGALILYPRYLDPATRLPCGPEIVIERLANPELWRPGPLVRARRRQGALTRKLGELFARPKLAGDAP